MSLLTFDVLRVARNILEGAGQERQADSQHLLERKKYLVKSLIWYFHFHFVSNSTVNLSLLFIYETFDGNKSRDLDKYERLATDCCDK